MKLNSFKSYTLLIICTLLNSKLLYAQGTVLPDTATGEIGVFELRNNKVDLFITGNAAKSLFLKLSSTTGAVNKVTLNHDKLPVFDSYAKNSLQCTHNFLTKSYSCEIKDFSP